MLYLPELFGTIEVAAWFGVRPSAVSNWVKRGQLIPDGYAGKRPVWIAENVRRMEYPVDGVR